MPKGTFVYTQQRLENDLVVLEPFDPNIHTTRLLEELKVRPSPFIYVPFPVMDTKADFMRELYDKDIASSAENCLYAIMDKIKPSEVDNIDGNYAGIISLNGTNPVNAVTEIGVVIFPTFQRTHISTNAIGLLLLWTLDPPSAGGLGLRRVEWKTHADNAPSRRAALRMGFEFEGIARWQRVCELGLPVEALEKRNGTKGELPGRHTASFSIVWDEWDDKRPKVIALMERK